MPSPETSRRAAAAGVSVVMPALDEADEIESALRSLQTVREAGGEVVLVDGGSRDDTVARARPWVDRVVSANPGRARQMNAGAAAASGEVLWFVHADTRVDPAALLDLQVVAADPRCAWGYFGVRLSGRRPLFRTIAWLMNLRSRVSGIATGDQGLFVRRQLFLELGGYPDIALMEDIALCRELKRHARRCPLPVRLTTSSRRWQERGPWRTIALMWRLRWAYWRGADPAELARRYRG